MTIPENPHTIVTVDKSTPWRDFADELTDHQREIMERSEGRLRAAGVLDDPSSQHLLLECTLEYTNGNRIDADHAHVPIPDGARLAPSDGWERHCDGHTYSRALTWQDFETGVDGVGLDISGRQSTDGTYTRAIQMYTDGAQMDAHQARRLAQALTEAAVELERLQ